MDDVEVMHVFDGLEKLLDVIDDLGLSQLGFRHEIREKLAAVEKLLHHQQPETRLRNARAKRDADGE